MKVCCVCKESKPESEYGPDRRRPDGLTPRCRECNRAYLREWKRKNADRKLEINREWNRRNAAYYREYRRAWREKNPELNREADRRWREANPDKVRDKDARRRAAKRGAKASAVDLAALWEANGGLCQLCFEPIDRTLRFPHPMSPSVDHIVPLAKGGTHEQSNLQWTHLVENVRKGASVPEAITSAP